MLEIKNLHVKYKNSTSPVIQDISFSLEKGERIAILGPSGSGKSTLLSIIAGLLAENEATKRGQINWKNEKPTVRMVFQEATLLPWRTVEKNVAFGMEILKLSKAEILHKAESALRLVGLLDHAKRYPHELSVGMQQRVNFARALACEPDLLLLDEPFSALDVKTKGKIQKQFLDVLNKKRITTIFVTHDIEEAKIIAQKSYAIADGCLVKL